MGGPTYDERNDVRIVTLTPLRCELGIPEPSERLKTSSHVVVLRNGVIFGVIIEAIIACVLFSHLLHGHTQYSVFRWSLFLA